MDEEKFKKYSDLIEPSIPGLWSEKVMVITEDYEIRGYVFMPRTGRKNRVLSDILNGNRRFVAVKDVEITYRKFPDKQKESQDFIQINLDSIVLLRPIPEDF
jgi:hypothetical protein